MGSARGMDSRGVSEVVGFVLVFSLVTASVGFIYVNGSAVLEDWQDAERVNNAERAFDALADNVEDVTRRGAPSRATEIELTDARLAFGNETTMNVTVDGHSYQAELTPLVYSGGSNTRIAYEAGAVVRSDGAAAIVKTEPELSFDQNRKVITLVETVPARNEPRSVAGSTTVLVRAERIGASVVAIEDDPTSVTLNVTTTPERAIAWERYLDEEIEWKTDACGITGADSNRVTCEFQPKQIYVRLVTVRIALS